MLTDYEVKIGDGTEFVVVGVSHVDVTKKGVMVLYDEQDAPISVIQAGVWMYCRPVSPRSLNAVN